jgi:hypothetical protein
VNPGSQVAFTESRETAITIGEPDSGSVGSGTTVDIWAGAVDTGAEDGPTGIANEELTIDVTRPDGETAEFTELMDDNGSVSVPYDTPDDVSGTYEATVTDSEGTTASARFDVGPVLEPTTQSSRSRPVLSGEETEFRFLLRDGQSPIAGQEVTVTATLNGDGNDESTVVTDENGFVTISASPAATGDWEQEATATVDGVDLSASISYPVSEIGYEYDFFRLDDVVAGYEAAQGGRVWTGDGPLANTEIELTYSNAQAGVDITRQTTTDGNGFFAIRFAVPSGPDELTVALETTDGRTAALGTFEDEINVNDPDSDDDPDTAEVTARFEEFRVAPGGSAALNITATEADGEPIANEPIGVIVRFGFSGDGAPIDSITAETDANGEATVEINVPETAPDYERLNAAVVLNRAADRLTDDDGISVESVDASVSRTFDDGQLDMELQASATGTEDPVKGHSVHVDAQYVSGRTGSILGDRLVSNADGTDTATASTPDDLSFMIGFNELSKGNSDGGFSIEVAPYPGRLSSNPDGGEPVAAGADLPIEFDDVPADSVSGLLYGSIGDIPIAATFDTATGKPAIPIPADVIDDSARVRAWGVGSDGELYGGFTSVSVDPDSADSDPGDEPTDPQQRALQITDRSSAGEITQNDVTVAVTRFNRGQSANGIDITQNDVTTIITLFERS